MKGKLSILITGAIVGLAAIVLVAFGNPANMGFCIACFLRDIAGALGFHRAEVVQYIRPEIVGLVCGAFIFALINREYAPRGGSSPFTRFILSIFVMIGALMFLGCPLRMVLRLAGGDLNAVFGLVGFVAGIVVGIFFLNKGFNLKKSYKLGKLEGAILPAAMVGLFALLIAAPAFIFFSEKGPGAATAPVLLSLAIGLVVGALAQKTRLCTVGGIRDAILFKDMHLLTGFLSIFVVALIANLFMGKFNLGFENQPVAHMDGLWNFLGMGLVGWASVLLGGCPLRQLILAGEGNTDSAVSVIGLIVGAAIAHNFGLASSPAGPTFNGQVAVIVGFVVTLIISWRNSEFLTKGN